MKRTPSPRAVGLVLVVLLASMQTAVAQQKDPPRLKVFCERADAIYRVGDTAYFNITPLPMLTNRAARSKPTAPVNRSSVPRSGAGS